MTSQSKESSASVLIFSRKTWSGLLNFYQIVGPGPASSCLTCPNLSVNPITCPGILSNESVRGGHIVPPLCFSGTNGPIILKFGMLMARTILMDFSLVPEQNIRNFRKNSGISGKIPEYIFFRNLPDPPEIWYAYS